MTHGQRALAKNAQKVRGVLDRCPDGVTLSQITGDTQLSSAAARAALLHMKAECEDGLWFEGAGIDAAEPEPVTSVPELVTIAESAPVEPVTIELAQVDWSKAPDDATHFQPEGASKGGNLARYFKDGFKSVCAPQVVGGGWRLVESLEIDLTGVIEIPRPEPVCTTCETKTDIAPLSLTGECQQCYEDAVDKAWWDERGGAVAPDKSDFAIALEAERQRVFDAVATLATAERVAELTKLHIDDVRMHLDTLIQDGAIFERPIIFGYGYEVAS